MIAIAKVIFRTFLLCTVVLLCLKQSFDGKRFLRSLSVPFEKTATELLQSSQTMLFEMQSKATLIALCKELTRENVNLKSQLERDSDLKNRLTSLEKLTHMGQEFSCKKIFARVIGRHLSPWFESVTLNRGEAQGIKKNAIVLAHFGVVGKVTKVFENFSTVSLTSCPKFRLAVCLDNFSVPMIFSGGGASYVPDATGHYGWKASGTVKNIPMEAEPMLKKSGRIIAFPLGIDIPHGLSLGHIENVHPTTDGMFLEAEISLPKELTDFREVVIPITDDP